MLQFRKTVESILKKHNITLNEDVKADYTLIKEAEVVWKAFVDHAKEDIKNIVDNINNQTSYEYRAQVLDDLTIVIDWEYILHHENAYYSKVKDLIQIHLIEVLDYYYPYYQYIEERDGEQFFCNITEKQFISILNSNPIKSTFLHEYQHYKYRNSKKTSRLLYRAKTDDNGKIIYDKYYYTDPNEFNSFTLQDIDQAIKAVKKRLADAIRNEGLKPDDKDGIKAIIRNYMKGFYAYHYEDIKNRDWHEHVNKRVYSMLYYLFVENNIANAKKIYNNLKKQIIDEPKRVNDILYSLESKLWLMLEENAPIINISSNKKEKYLYVLYYNDDGLGEKMDEIAKSIAGKYFDSIENYIDNGFNVKKINIK